MGEIKSSQSRLFYLKASYTIPFEPLFSNAIINTLIFINSLAFPLIIFCFALFAQALSTIFYFRIFIFIFHSWILLFHFYFTCSFKRYEQQHSKMVPAYRMWSPRALPGTDLCVWPYK
nr:transmembrane protein 257 [Aotus nancymaae]